MSALSAVETVCCLNIFLKSGVVYRLLGSLSSLFRDFTTSSKKGFAQWWSKTPPCIFLTKIISGCFHSPPTPFLPTPLTSPSLFLLFSPSFPFVFPCFPPPCPSLKAPLIQCLVVISPWSCHHCCSGQEVLFKTQQLPNVVQRHHQSCQEKKARLMWVQLEAQ